MMLYLTINIDYPLRHDRIHEIITGLNTDFGEDFYSYFSSDFFDGTSKS